MSRGAASSGSRIRPPGPPALSDASTLGVACINVGMQNEHRYGNKQDEKVDVLAGWVREWLNVLGEGEDVVVGINELHPTIATKLVELLCGGADAVNVGVFTHYSNTLLWRACVCV